MSEISTSGLKRPPLPDVDVETMARTFSQSLKPEILPSAPRPVNDLESHLRGLILSNGIPTKPQEQHSTGTTSSAAPFDGKVPGHLHPGSLADQQNPIKKHVVNTSPNPIPPHLRSASPATQQEYVKKHNATSASPAVSQQKPRKKPSQAERRQNRAKLDILALPAPAKAAVASGAVAHTPATIEPQGNGGSQQLRPRVQHQTSKTHPHNGHQLHRFNYGHTLQFGSHNFGPPNMYQNTPRGNYSQQHQSHLPPQVPFTRPPPQNPRLFEPGTHGQPPTPHPHGPHREKINFAPRHAQIDYLNRVAEAEVEKAEIKFAELEAHEALRLRLEQICQSSIATYEQLMNKHFDAKSVALKCFGSLSSGFATYTSDMDLALISPSSKPDSASTESPIPRLLEKAFLDLGYGARLLTRTRVPIIKFCEQPTPELAEALNKERAKWEEGKDKPARPKVQGRTTKIAKKKEAEDLKVSRIAPEKDRKDNAKSDGLGPGCEVPNPDAAYAPVESEDPVHGSILSTKMKNSLKDLSSDDEARGTLDTSDNPECLQAREVVDDVAAIPLAEDVDVGAGDQSPVDGETIEDEIPERSDKELVRLYVLAISEGWYDDSERQIIAEFVDAVKNHGSEEEQEHAELTVARAGLQNLPDVLKRYREPRETHLDFPKTGVGIQCDINFSNHLALHNTLLLRCYSRCDPRVRPMVLFVKAWAKRRKINSPYHGTLSSYGYVLMVLHFLVNIVQPPIAPNLQLSWRPPPPGIIFDDVICDGYDVRFWRSEREIRDLASRGMLTHNRESLGSLLRGFFQYFAVQGPNIIGSGFAWTVDVLSLRTFGGLLSKQQKGWTGAKTTTTEPTATGQEIREVKHRYLLAIEDPFEIDHNIGRTVVHSGIVAIRDEFRRANKIIQTAGMGDNGASVELFLEVKDKISEQPRTFFGPRPKPEATPVKKVTTSEPKGRSDMTNKGQSGSVGEGKDTVKGSAETDGGRQDENQVVELDTNRA
ncbi:hypothetical protein MMC24_002737 [Lignoscripta atroalba]|nr:hypothetical protein [Lignoscripta atroalba]